MKVVLQRVNSASVEVQEKNVGAISRGLLLLVGLGKEDSEASLRPMAEKIVHMRIFPDDAGRFHHSLIDVRGEILAVSQFTLFADTSKGRRPDFFAAMEPAEANRLFEKFVDLFRQLGITKVATGTFGAHMNVRLDNDGPVTICLDM